MLIATRPFLILALASLAAACSGNGDQLSPPTTGGLVVTVSGLPSGAAANVTVSGPNGFSQALPAANMIDNLVPGTYTVAAASVSSGGTTYSPVPATQQVQVVASTSRTSVSVAYGAQSSQLSVTIAGLPGGTDAAVQVTSAAGYSQAVTATTTLSGLAAGLYTLTASAVTSGPATFAPSPASQQVQVTTGNTASASVTYALSVAGTVNLLIDGVTITQSVQSYEGGVPLVANRDAYLRVFVRADQANTATPAVRVRLFQGSNPTPVETYTLTAPHASVPSAVDQGTLNSSWNQLIPAARMTTDLRMMVDVDPSNGVPESNEDDNSYPASGQQEVLDVRAVNAFNLHLVPLAVKSLTGNVTSGNMSQFVVTLKKVMPLQAVNVTLRPAVFSSGADSLVSDNGNGAWGTVLSEVYALQQAEGSGKNFYGVVKTGYSSGVAGIGYVPGRAAVGWDRLPSGDDVLAHEVGHNLSLNHAPCGTAGNPDPGYPYPDGSIGVWGLDVALLTLKPPSTKDLMGYCGGSNWISDYNYKKALAYREAVAGAVVMGAESGLLVWGRIVNGVVSLEPSFEISAPPSLPVRRGPYLLEGLDARGRVLFSYPFDGEVVADQDADQRQFAFVIPLGGTRSERLAQLRVRSGFSTAQRSSAAALAVPAGGRAVMLQQQPASSADAGLEGQGTVRLRWNRAAYPMAMVRDAATGSILGFARRGDASLVIPGREMIVTFSDGVRSRDERLTAR